MRNDIEINLFYSKTTEQYYWIGEANCNKCKKEIRNLVYLNWDFQKGKIEQKIYCRKCREELTKTIGTYTETKIAIKIETKEAPKDLQGKIPIKQPLTNVKNITTWDCEKIEADKTKDLRIRQEEKKQIEQITKEQIELQTEKEEQLTKEQIELQTEKEEHLTEEQIEQMLNELQKAQPA